MPTADPHGEMEAHYAAGAARDSEPEWRCAGCGALAPNRIAPCNCATDCLYDRATRRFHMKADATPVPLNYEEALREIVRLRTATDEGSLRMRADLMYEIARKALGDPVPGT